MTALRPGFAARHRRGSRLVTLAADQRRGWLAVVAQALSIDAADREATGALAHEARGLTAASFPVGEAAAHLTADALLTQVRALAVAAIPERRALYGAAARAIAQALDALIHDERARLAQGTWMRPGGGPGGD